MYGEDIACKTHDVSRWFLRDLYMMWSKTYKSIYVELHKMDREYIVLIEYGGISRNSKDWEWSYGSMGI